MAIECARVGKIVSLISSEDAGIYGISGLVFEVIKVRGMKDELSFVLWKWRKYL